MTTTAVSFPVRVEEVPERRVAARHIGPYNQCGLTFQKLRDVGWTAADFRRRTP